jgi:Ca2+/Na+ antiporter
MIMVLGYGSYIVFMVFNEKIMESCAGSPKYQVMPELTDEVNKEEARELEKQFEAAMIKHSKDEKDEQNEEGDVEMAPPKEENRPSSAPEDPEEEEEESVFDMPEGLMDRIMFIITLPFLVLFHFTIPQVDKEAWKNWYWFAFGMSILWIGVLCHYMVDFATRIACTLHISPIVLGLLVLAVGTSVPDAIGSMIAAREGEADMAIANAIGSNVFDILLGLGLPWFLKSIIFGEVNTVDKNGVFDSVIILFITVILFVLVLLINKWKMDKRAGLGLFGLYFVYVLYTIISEATNG